ncbi:MAG: leucine-rich repeat domain-containing protein, partial [Thermoguttaceae bacterium]|nr:leucine-rich repeat domain-containing protein [Thermoguttaceae bacterium]
AFGVCDSLTSISLPDGVQTIGKRGGYCYLLEEIPLPTELQIIGGAAFYDCDSLTDVEIPASVKEIGRHFFPRNADLVIRGDAGSYAEEYARENDIRFEVRNASAAATNATP